MQEHKAIIRHANHDTVVLVLRVQYWGMSWFQEMIVHRMDHMAGIFPRRALPGMLLQVVSQPITQIESDQVLMKDWTCA